ncbi:hypothetical protein SDJN02_09656, partial [Cucurbita argyrosperma subsp. argyrosperma]
MSKAHAYITKESKLGQKFPIANTSRFNNEETEKLRVFLDSLNKPSSFNALIISRPTIESTPTTDFNHESIPTINSNHGSYPTTIESPTEPSIQHPLLDSLFSQYLGTWLAFLNCKRHMCNEQDNLLLVKKEMESLDNKKSIGILDKADILEYQV